MKKKNLLSRAELKETMGGKEMPSPCYNECPIAGADTCGGGKRCAYFPSTSMDCPFGEYLCV